MAAIDDLPPDQRAVLQLLLKQGQSYEGIAGMLGMGAEAVRTRAHAAVESLVPESGGRPSSDEEITDFLLGQLDEDSAKATLLHMGASARARKWGRAVRGELRPLAGDAVLPKIPKGAKGGARRTPVEGPVPTKPPPPKRPAKRSTKRPAAAAAPPVDSEPATVGEAKLERPVKRPAAAPPVDIEPVTVDEAERAEPEAAPAPARPSSQLGGALLIGGIAILVVVLLIVLFKGRSDSDQPSTTGTATKAATAPKPAPAEQPKVIAQINMRGPGKAVAVAQVLIQAGTRAIAIIGQGLQPSSAKSAYAVWLYNSAADARRLGFAPPVGKNGRLEGVAPLPEDSQRFQDLIVTRETNESAKRPGSIVLRGKLKVGSTGGASTQPGTSTQPGASTQPPTSTQPGASAQPGTSPRGAAPGGGAAQPGTTGGSGAAGGSP